MYAESLLLSSALKLNYLATGQVEDAEIKLKVKIHQDRRDARWTTFEEPLDLGECLRAMDPATPVLIDCATMWLSNHMMAGSDLVIATEKLLDDIDRCPAPSVIVSNEVGHGIVPDNRLARQFREAQGKLNIALAAQADLAVMVVAGLPQVLKGELP
ncbi:bifunctional adenosylcobinamide kinase/adenosylcobinamide-phosphate guanylyltransferase [Sulfitobacter sp. S190]|uniref:bifunctional adenosylcobinamide kinase/adenosylcobinamide-phosphate guanylyltransferase n=1 Tax=Sulfitobacter sp. S190 TaxID=2867022 RepID=UPI0038FC6698